MEDLTTLVWFSLAMFVGSYMAGLLPLAFSMSQSRMRLVTIFGAGLLVGTALCVIVPEGVETLYDAKQDAYDVKSRIAEAESILRDPGKMIDKPRILPRNSRLFHRNKTEVSEFTERRKRAKGKTDKNRRIIRHISPIFLQQPPLNADSTGAYHADDVRAPLKSENTNEKGIDQSIGLPLICGFVFMLMVDQFTRSAQGKGPDRSRFKITATLGLVVHAAADGVALGSASATHRTDIQLIVFLAIMLHKSPAAFGLVSFLLLEGLERSRIRKHLLIFSFSAPATAILTFYAITSLGSELLSSQTACGILMLFSAGTFLYVSTVHILPELMNDDYQPVDPVAGIGHTHSVGPSFSLKELAAILVGAFCPALLASGHSH